MRHPPISVESKARMTPSVVLADVRPRGETVACGCCRRRRERGWVDHYELGPLCVWCSLAFDPRLSYYRPFEDIGGECPLCAEGDCPLHDA